MENKSEAMSKEVQIIHAEIPAIRQIIRNECWLEAERRGAPVDPHEDLIRERVADIILSGAGSRIRRQIANGERMVPEK